ncbi:ionotropic receptor 75a-like [Achroia grisella]|uniref:ionotropic receptor 75a-like n=1 Tax=Achroia grisella TaxID=688607 RepID=UPI0027D2DB47|nr:ionotropic receptor 75a-like [Achroia grisella]
MKCTIGLIFLFLPIVLSLDDMDMKFTVNYFKMRYIKTLCLLDCKNNTWSKKLTKYANAQMISVLNVQIGKTLNYGFIDVCLEQRLPSIGVFIDTNCALYENILVYASENTRFDSRHKWLLIDHNKNSSSLEINDDILEALNHLNLSLNADIVIGKSMGSTVYKLYDIYNFGKLQGGELIADELGTWYIYSGVDDKLKINDYKYYRRWNFQQIPLKLITVMSKPPKEFDPKIIADTKPNANIPVITITGNIILNVIAEIHNFRFIYTITDRWLGDFSRNSSKVVASSLYFRTQDISPVIRFINETLKRIDIIHPPLTSIETRYYYRIPTYGVGKLQNQFLRPLSAGAWLSVLLVVTLCSILLLLSAILEQRSFSGQYAVFSVIASICQQYFEDNDVNTRRRSSFAREVTIFITGIFCVLIYNYYTSSVVSWLLNAPPPSITSLEELLESPLELIFEDIGYTRSWLQTPSYYCNKRNEKVEDLLRKKKVLNKKQSSPLLEPVEKGIAMVKSGGYAYHMEVDNANRLISKSFTQTELCELGSLQSMDKTNLYACLQKDSPYKEFFAWSVARLLERGIVSCIQRRTRSQEVKCEGSSPRALALGGAAPAFLLLAFGYLLATVIMLLERLVQRTKERVEVGKWLNGEKRKCY